MIISPSYIAQVRITRATCRSLPWFLEKRNKKLQVRRKNRLNFSLSFARTKY